MWTLFFYLFTSLNTLKYVILYTQDLVHSYHVFLYFIHSSWNIATLDGAHNNNIIFISCGDEEVLFSLNTFFRSTNIAYYTFSGLVLIIYYFISFILSCFIWKYYFMHTVWWWWSESTRDSIMSCIAVPARKSSVRFPSG